MQRIRIINTRIFIMAHTGDRASWLQGPEVACKTTASKPYRPWRLVLLGAPGVGKGTQAELLCKKLGACHLSTGDVFRYAKSNCSHTQSPAMEEALDYMKRGELVPDKTVIDMVAERAHCLNCAFGFLLDGYPRTVEQAEALTKALDDLGAPLDAVLSYELPIEQIVSRLSGRRTCTDCKNTYHVTGKPTKVEGVCDNCGGELIQREDDQPETIKVRMKAYEESTKPLLDYFKAQGKLIQIEANGSPEEIFERSVKIMENTLPKEEA